METKKSKAVAKLCLPRGESLRRVILETLATIRTMVGDTLGPGGRPVILERQEYGLPPVVTKDGVTVFRAVGFRDPFAQNVLEATREVAIRTANEAGDGTTTATILLEALTRLVFQFCDSHPGVSPQAVVRRVHSLYEDFLAPALANMAIRATLDGGEGTRILRAVAEVSANGDGEMADAVMRAFDVCGDYGNVTLAEGSGIGGYQVEPVMGYPMAGGYEQTLGKVAGVFINRPELGSIVLDKPAFLLYYGAITQVQSMAHLLDRMQEAWAGEYLKTPNLVICATGFSETVLSSLARYWPSDVHLKILPVRIPLTVEGQRATLDDLAAVVGGAEVYDPVTNPLDGAQFEGLGNLWAQPGSNGKDYVWAPAGVERIEVTRYQTTVIGRATDDPALERIAEVQVALRNAGSELEATLIRERLAKLTGGIARLTVLGSSNADTKERRDRAEDAICAVRAALKHGAVPGGCWALGALAHSLEDVQDPHSVEREILIPALRTPFEQLLANIGVTGSERVKNLVEDLEQPAEDVSKVEVLDIRTQEWIPAVERGILDALPAVRDALRNAISAAAILGTCGGIVAFPRDDQFERDDAHHAREWERWKDHNPADERA